MEAEELARRAGRVAATDALADQAEAYAGKASTSRTRYDYSLTRQEQARARVHTTSPAYTR